MKHICIVTSAHPWDDVRVGSRMAATFVEAGYRVTWVGPDRTISADRDARQPGVDYRLFMPGEGRIGRLTGGGRAVALAKEVSGVDWWYAPDPDVAGKLPGLARALGGRTMFDVHESYHGGLLNRWFPGTPPNFVRELLRRRIARTCRKIDLVVGVSHRVLEPYCEGHPRSIVVRNLAPDFFNDTTSTRSHRPMAPVRMLHGKIAEMNGTSQVAASIEVLSEEIQQEMTLVMLDVSGTTAEMRDKVLATGTKLQYPVLEVIPGVPHEQMSDLMAPCAVGIIAYQRDLGHDSLPNRLFEYMAAGMAILAPLYSPEIVRILDEEQIGLTADFEVPSDIARAITWCVEHPDEVKSMGERARIAYRERYTWASEAERMVDAIRSLEP